MTETGQGETEWEAWESPIKRKKSSRGKELRGSCSTRGLQVRETKFDLRDAGSTQSWQSWMKDAGCTHSWQVPKSFCHLPATVAERPQAKEFTQQWEVEAEGG